MILSNSYSPCFRIAGPIPVRALESHHTTPTIQNQVSHIKPETSAVATTAVPPILDAFRALDIGTTVGTAPVGVGVAVADPLDGAVTLRFWQISATNPPKALRC